MNRSFWIWCRAAPWTICKQVTEHQVPQHLISELLCLEVLQLLQTGKQTVLLQTHIQRVSDCHTASSPVLGHTTTDTLVFGSQTQQFMRNPWAFLLWENFLEKTAWTFSEEVCTYFTKWEWIHTAGRKVTWGSQRQQLIPCVPRKAVRAVCMHLTCSCLICSYMLWS